MNFLNLSLLFILIACKGYAEEPSTIIPVRSTLKKFMPRLHEEKLSEAKTGIFDFVMIGDSITHGWSRHPKLLEGQKFLNLGFPGDRAQNVLWRLQKGAVDGISPLLVTLLIGTNHMHASRPQSGFTPDSTEDILTGIHAVILELKNRLPQSKIFIFSVFPRKSGEENDRVEALNQKLPELAEDLHISHHSFNQVFLDRHGNQNLKFYSRDRLHLNVDGYTAWKKVLLPLLIKELN